MGVKLNGEKAVMEAITRKYGGVQMQQVIDKALIAGAEVFVKELRKEFEKFKDTGASLDEITVGKPETVGGERRITIYWKGPKNRKSIIHLNEFGTINNPNPAGKGAVARAMKNSEKAYRAVVKEEMRRLGRG